MIQLSSFHKYSNLKRKSTFENLETSLIYNCQSLVNGYNVRSINLIKLQHFVKEIYYLNYE